MTGANYSPLPRQRRIVWGTTEIVAKCLLFERNYARAPGAQRAQAADLPSQVRVERLAVCQF